MLRIKQGVDLKELEKFRISGYSNSYTQRLSCIKMSKETYIYIIPDTLFDLIKANMVEKVVEEC